MDGTNIGAGAGAGGIVGALISWLGIRDKFSLIQKEMERLDDKAVWRPTCAATHKSVDERLDRIEVQQDKIESKVDAIHIMMAELIKKEK